MTTDTADFLVELGTEELPPKALRKLSEAFRIGVEKGLDTARVSHGEILAYATPRRLAVFVNKLQLQQPIQKIENRGPPVAIAYDDAGQPTKAALAFASKCGIKPQNLTTIKTDKGEWLYYSGEAPGAKTADLLGDIVANALSGLPIPKRMRWGDSSVEFVRPVHWLVMLLDADVVPAKILGLQAGRQTRGHRFHAPGLIELGHPAEYAERLHSEGKVIVDMDARRSLITEAARQAAAKLGAEAVLDEGVVSEVTALVEWPVPVPGSFDKKFLRLPREVLISTLQDHQRYFPLEADGELQPAFITISNLESIKPEEVRRGNERVVLPRLADAAFFWDQDCAISLADRLNDLRDVVYQKGLGSLHDKAQRVAQLAGLLASYLEIDIEPVNRAAELARTDLLTAMVGEFPELQGRMGYYYATHDGEAEAVAIAIEEQYLPRHAGDRLPATPTGQALSIADRLDTLAGVFALGKRPSGNKDPFGLRRQALGLVRILVERGIEADLPALLSAAVELQPQDGPSRELVDELYEFIVERMRTWYLAGQAPGLEAGAISTEMFDAVKIRKPQSPLDIHQRLLAVQQFVAMDEADSLAAANKRIANILRKAGDTPAQPVLTDLFEADAESALYAATLELIKAHKQDLEKREYATALQRLAGLRAQVDAYFDEVMVMTDDKKQRSNRLAQLNQLRNLFLDVADISCIPASQ